jgi:hypothetical protein
VTTPAATTAPARKRRFPWWLYAILFVLIAVFAISPIIPISIAGSLAEQHGCTLHEGFVNPCIVDGKDIGKDLYGMGMMGWLFLATVPIGLGALVVWLVGMIIHRVLWGRANSRQPEAP